MIRYLNRIDCCSKIENLSLVSTHSHIKGTWLYLCNKCMHCDYYPVEQVELAQLEVEGLSESGEKVEVF